MLLYQLFSNQNTRAFFDKRVYISTENIPKGKTPALKGPVRINGTVIIPAVKEQAFKFAARKTFTDGISAVNRDKIFAYKVNHIDLQETGDVQDFIVIYTDLSRLAPATVPWTTGTCPRIKTENKTILVNNVH
ncbi:hypothetical protein PITCH_A190005 [uncultured Desulfobacterium sp.]|uniref:Uncharacterized protein n=1 Tax=uncultured Desulfobacterium sp. TaxID=201089 RepID=A0A445MVK2_9BACT|nr:hypothetical protein PITCH_A190005 [uncultured Desulfobacterium sp.]